MNQSTNKRIIRLKPVRPVISIGLGYQKDLIRLVDSVISEYKQYLLPQYKDLQAQIALDADPSTQLKFLINKIHAEQAKKFNARSDKLADNFIGEVSNNTYKQLKNNLGVYNITIRPDRGYIGALQKQKALINENVSLIVDLEDELYKQIYGDVMRSVSVGGDLQQLQQDLIQRGIETKKRAQLISRDQLFKATGIIDNQRQLDNGITKSEWLHSGGGKTQRIEHVKANGRIFETAKGCPIKEESGKEKGQIQFILPGEKINCRCQSAPVIEL